MRKLIILFAFVSLQLASLAQSDDWESIVEELAEEIGESYTGGEESAALEAQIDELTDLHEHPFDLNTATREQLLSLPFLSEAQVEAIMDYRSRYGALRSSAELHLVRGLGLRELRWLSLCTYVANEPASVATRRAAGGRQEMMTRLDVPLYNRDGWPWARGLAHRWRYTAQTGSHWDLSARAEKDAGEPMFNRQNPLWDAWGAHAMLSRWRFVETLIVGDFKAVMGEGLVINNGFHLGKQLTSLWRRPAVLRPHRSAEEERFLRGAAATVRFTPPVSLTALYSYRQLDATVQPDNSVRAVNTSGLHRTASELDRRRSLACHTTAAHLAWDGQHLRLGASAMYQYYDHQFRQGTSLYRQIYPEGYQFGAVSADYALRLRNFYVSGEVARSMAALKESTDALNPSSGRGWAMLNKATFRFNPNTSLSAVQRFYSRNYFSALASAYGENGAVQNESGITLLADADRVGPFALRAFVDLFYSPWPRYSMTRASRGFETVALATCSISRSQRFTIRYSLKSKERSDRRFLTSRLRANYSMTLSERLSLQASAFATHVAAASPSQQASGIAIMPRIDYASISRRLRCSLAATLFATGLGSPAAYTSGAYDSRLFLYEPSLFQSFGMVNLFGKGERLAASVRWQASRRWQLQAKCGVTHYHDRDRISSGPTTIRSPWRTDLQLLARWQFKR